MKVKVVFCLFLFASFYACLEREPPASRTVFKEIKTDRGIGYIKMIFNRKNKLLIEEHLNSDSVNHGLYQSYYRSSLVKVKGEYVNGLKEGVWMHYDTLGKLISKQNWFQDKRFGEQFFYGSDGQIKEYCFMNLSGKRVYRAEFKNNTIVKSEGTPFYIAYTGDSVQCDNEYVILIFFGVPPGLKYEISTTEYLLPDRKEISSRDYSSPKGIDSVFWGKRIELNKIYRRSSTYEWKIEFKFYNERGIVSTTSEAVKIKVICK